MFMKVNRIQHIFMTPNQPSSNGQAKPNMHTVKETLKKMEADRKTILETKVNRFLFTYKITPHTASGVARAELISKWQLRTAFHLMKPDTYQVFGYKNKMEQGIKVMPATFENSKLMILCCYVILNLVNDGWKAP